jgi:hypothetical protein
MNTSGSLHIGQCVHRQAFATAFELNKKGG